MRVEHHRRAADHLEARAAAVERVAPPAVGGGDTRPRGRGGARAQPVPRPPRVGVAVSPARPGTYRAATTSQPALTGLAMSPPPPTFSPPMYQTAARPVDRLWSTMSTCPSPL